jgi:hypothetical protein
MIGEQYQITGTYSKVWESERESMTFNEYIYGNEVGINLGYSINGAYYISEREASAYSNESIYPLNSYCTHENQVYKCNTAIDTAEEWDATHWDLIADVDAMVTEGIFVPMDITPDSNGIFTPTKFYVHVEGGNNADTCVHLVGDGSRNGEYEQYKENNVSIPITTLTGKLNGEGKSVVVFPDGMKRAGSVCDEIVIKNGKAVAIKRVGSVDLGTLDWTKRTGVDGIFQSESVIRLNYKYTKDTYMVCSIALYKGTVQGGATVTTFTDKTFAAYYHQLHNSRVIYYKDSAYVDAAAFKTAMQGVLLYFELATPQEYELDDFQLPISIQADAFGTEEQTIPNGTSSAPATIGIKYAIDAVGFILNAPKNYISAESMDNFLSQLGAAMGGTWTKTWNESSGKWDFSFTQNVTPQDNND